MKAKEENKVEEYRNKDYILTKYLNISSLKLIKL